MTSVNMENPLTAQGTLCPLCRNRGKSVGRITIESLLTDEAKAGLADMDGFRFCPIPTCQISYFHPETGKRFLCRHVRVRIGQKQTQAPRPICYCFNHTIEEIESDVAKVGTSEIPEAIAEKCSNGLARCEQTNPQGSCCIGNVRKVLEDAQSRFTKSRSVQMETNQYSNADGTPQIHDCCASHVPPERIKVQRKGNVSLWAASGAILSAVLSAACCWLPLLLIALGASAVGISGFFETYRLYLLAATGLFLAIGFYLVYFRKESCESGSTCAVAKPRLIRFNKVVLWVATVAVLLFALFPNYLVFLVGSGKDNGSVTAFLGESRLFRIEGMTCEGCAVNLRAQLLNMPGVVRADVSYKDKAARIFFDSRVSLPPDRKVQEAIKQAGYRGYPGPANPAKTGAQG